ncbi:NAD(P)-binding domain-containing protein [Streptomyces sp. NPDC046203]|uniref:flavin-containing monooxygenase n=1 Tax=Streptomyces sp. NPDC046203 TaxID=3154602 RepID=UPI0033C4016B
MTTPLPHPVYVIGGGPGGLAVAAALTRRGVRTVVLERADAVGASWRGHYDRLRLHTTRRLSALPGLKMPRSFGRWVARADVVRYLERYAEFHDLEIVTGVEVERVERTPQDDNGAGAGDGSRAGTGAGANPQSGNGTWTLHATGGRQLVASAVVVATGFNHTPRMPEWPGAEAYAATTGRELLHASAYRTPKPYAGRDVLVVGVGNTGAEIAADLAEGGAARVRLAVRTAPYIVRRSTLGWPSQRNGILARRLPVWLVDAGMRLFGRFLTADLSAYGMARPAGGLYARARAGAIPVQDVGLVAAVRAGKVEPVGAVTGFEDGEVLLVDGTRIAPDTVIAATGYRRALEPLVGHLGVLDGRGRPRVRGGRCARQAPGIYFQGFTNPLSGMLRELGLDADRIARRIARTAHAPSRTGQPLTAQRNLKTSKPQRPPRTQKLPKPPKTSKAPRSPKASKARETGSAGNTGKAEKVEKTEKALEHG